MKKIYDEKLELDNENKNSLREIEQFYTNNKVDTMFSTIDKAKEEICKKIEEYSKEHLKPNKWDKDGNPISYCVKYSPLVINNYFFKSIIDISSQEPLYNAEKLGMVFDYYCYIIAEVNDKIGNYPSSLTSFCKLAGITANTLRSYKNSEDLNMRIIAEKIYDQIGDTNITMSQLGMVNEKSTIFKMKAQNEIIEKQQPTVHINITEKPDIEKISERIDKYKKFAIKKGK